jgi:hypothetical protein
MNLRVISAAVSAAIIGSAMPAMAASILIDDFGTDQRVEDLPSVGATNNSQVTGSDIIGGYRDLLVETDTSSTDAAELIARNDILEFNNVTQATGRGWVTYDGSNVVGDASGNVDTSGLGGIDLSMGDDSATGFLFDVVAVDLPGWYIEIRAWDTSGGFAEYTETLPAGGGNPFVSFASFTGTVDWSQIGALQFFAQTGPDNDVPALDGAIGRISVEGPDVNVIPLPASALLLLGGMGGFGALRLRKRKA